MSGAPEIDVAFDQRALERVLAAAGKAVDVELVKLALRGAQAFEGPLRKAIMAKLTKGPTGALARSVRSTLRQQSGDTISAIAGTDTIYARMQDEGGTIHAGPKKLAIPLGFAHVPKGKSPRDWVRGELFLVVRPGKPALLVSKDGPQYVLKDSVTLRGVGYRDAALEEGSASVEALVTAGLAEILARVSA